MIRIQSARIQVITNGPIESPSSNIPHKFIKTLGPGLITGAADDDPSWIAAYSQLGAQFGYSMGWIMVFSYPLMAAIQGLSAGIGAVTGKGLIGNLRLHHHPWPISMQPRTRP